MQEFKEYIRDNRIIFKYAKGKSEQSGREFHNYHEILYFVGGKATFVSENIYKELKIGDVVVIPKETYHRFLFIGDETEYQRCVFNFFDTDDSAELISKAMKNVAVFERNERFEFLFKKITDSTKTDYRDKTQIILMHSVLTLLLTEIADSKVSCFSGRKLNPVTEQSIEYINAHLCDEVKVENIAKAVGVSVSGIAHIFKNDMDISIYKFILEKKLLLANKKILMGIPTTVAANECGFGDYSGFYRQYKKMFGCSPSKKSEFTVN